MFCGISEDTPQEPVVSKKSGHVFEKRLIEKHIRSTGACPITKEALSLEDLIPLQIKAPFKPRPANLSSMPALLQTVQNEWDAVMLETYTVKQQLVETRKNLAKALYENDAAFRVIARLIKERDEARALLVELPGAASAPSSAAAGVGMEVEGNSHSAEDAGMTADVIAKLDDSAKALQKGRKKTRQGTCPRCGASQCGAHVQRDRVLLAAQLDDAGSALSEPPSDTCQPVGDGWCGFEPSFVRPDPGQDRRHAQRAPQEGERCHLRARGPDRQRLRRPQGHHMGTL